MEYEHIGEWDPQDASKPTRIAAAQVEALGFDTGAMPKRRLQQMTWNHHPYWRITDHDGDWFYPYDTARQKLGIPAPTTT